MNPQAHFRCLGLWCRIAAAAILILLLGLNTPLLGDPEKPGEKPVEKDNAKAKSAAPKDMPGIEVVFRDDSKLKMALRDERIEIVTSYGKLLIPAAEIRTIAFGFHIDAETTKHVEAAIAKLASSDFKEREAGSTELLALGEKAYPALLQAMKDKDMEVVRRADEVLGKIRDKVPPERLDRPLHDIIQTADSKFTGRIAVDTFKVKTFQFGDQQVQLGDLKTMRSLGALDPDVVVLADPGTMQQFTDKVGKTFVFRVTGGTQDIIWGTGVYTGDSALKTAAVHAGVLRNGQTGLVKVLIVIAPPAFDGTQQNGVTSSPYGPFQGAYQIVK
jgi:LCCL domain